jgi:hypothetical protein
MKRPFLAAFAFIAGITLASAIGAIAQEDGMEAEQELVVPLNPMLFDRDSALLDFEADSNPERALYLSAVQAMELGRRSGDMSHAEKMLNRIAGECPRQSVRTAVRRMLVAYYTENGDEASARTNLETIVAENMNQF